MSSEVVQSKDTTSPNESGDVEDRLARIEARLDRIERSLGRVTQVLDQAPALIATVTDVVDDELNQAAATGVDIDQRLRQLARVATKLSAPQTLTALERLADQGPALNQLVDLATSLPDGMAMAMDIFDDFVDGARQQGVDPVVMVERLEIAALRFAQLVQSPHFNFLLESKLLEPEVIAFLERAAAALTATAADGGPAPAGFFRLLGASRNDEVRSALGFAIAFARHFGHDLSEAPPRLPAPSD